MLSSAIAKHALYLDDFLAEYRNTNYLKDLKKENKKKKQLKRDDAKSNHDLFRIVNGVKTKAREFPFIVSLHNGRTHTCGGAIITKSGSFLGNHAANIPKVIKR